MSTALAMLGETSCGVASRRWQRHEALVTGLVLSVLGHIVLLLAWNGRSIDGATFDDKLAPELRVRLAAPAHRTEMPEAKPSKHVAPHVAGEMSAAAKTEAAAQTATMEAQVPLASASPTIDLEAVRTSARHMAVGARDGGDTSMSVAAPRAESETENPVGRIIAGSSRAGCIEQGAAYGLLAPVFHAYHLATDKPGTGCRY
jgi:hypothetical protein